MKNVHVEQYLSELNNKKLVVKDMLADVNSHAMEIFKIILALNSSSIITSIALLANLVSKAGESSTYRISIVKNSEEWWYYSLVCILLCGIIWMIIKKIMINLVENSFMLSYPTQHINEIGNSIEHAFKKFNAVKVIYYIFQLSVIFLGLSSVICFLIGVQYIVFNF